MEKNKIHKIDLIFIIGILLVGFFSSFMDLYYWIGSQGGFPVLGLMSIFVSYIFWFILLIYSAIKYKKETKKPQLVQWYMFYLLLFLHFISYAIGSAISFYIVKLF